ncbi:MAG: hypothetical protein L0Z62_47420 [Gemmataceae bacterium]|nr:hypothetical protein [Gemmataceae bacterium]
MTLALNTVSRRESIQSDWVEPEALASALHVEREDIHFHSLPDGRVLITVRVTNRSDLPTPPQPATLWAAPLGAFVPWRPLAVVMVPPLRPGESHELRTEARPSRPAPLGDPNRLPPDQLLTALGLNDDPAARPGRGVLPADLGQLFGRPNAHWAGNLNVFVGGRAVERHLAQALRVYPGRVNLALFVVGSGPDAYTFRLEGTGAAWDAALYFQDQSLAGLDLGQAAQVPQQEWVEVRRQSMMLLALVPPDGCAEGGVEVHVCQRSSGQEAVVEFSLSPDAAGPGCYTL